MADTEDGLDFGGGVGEKDGARHGAEIGESIAFVSVEFVGGSDEVARADDLAEFGEEGGVHCGCEKDSTRKGEMGGAESLGQVPITRLHVH